MAKHSNKLVFSLLAVVALTSCGGNPSDTSSIDSSVVTYEGKTNDDFKKANTSYVDASGNTKSLTRNTLYTNEGNPHLDSLTEQHVLVVPFGFEGKDEAYDQTDETIQRIKTTFFGTREELDKAEAWESLSTYFDKSSYGKATFTGQVANSWCIWDGKESDACSGITCAEYASKWNY